MFPGIRMSAPDSYFQLPEEGPAPCFLIQLSEGGSRHSVDRFSFQLDFRPLASGSSRTCMGYAHQHPSPAMSASLSPNGLLGIFVGAISRCSRHGQRPFGGSSPWMASGTVASRTPGTGFWFQSRKVLCTWQGCSRGFFPLASLFHFRPLPVPKLAFSHSI